jgi:uncharacterized protein
MQNKQLVEILGNRLDKYPLVLEQQFERVLVRIMELWGSAAAQDYFVDLLVDKRGNRTGFPPKVAEEIFFLSELHSLLFNRHGRQQPGSFYEDKRKVLQAEKRTEEFRAALEARSIKFIAPEFFRCVSGGDLAAVTLFVNAGMAIDTPNEQGWTPLMVALFEGREEIALFLIRKGADIDFADRSGYRPIHWAAFQGYANVIHEIVEREGNVNVMTDFGYTPLLQAAARGYAVSVQALIERGADPNIQDHEGWTALHKACGNNHVTVVKALIMAGASPSLTCADGANALHIAARLGHEELVQFLLEAGAGGPMQDQEGGTALHIAAARNHLGVIERILQIHPQPCPRDRNGATPLVWALRAGAIAAARRLVHAGARIQEVLAVNDADRVAASGGRGIGRALADAAGWLRAAEKSLTRLGNRLHRCVERNDATGVLQEIAKGANLNQRDSNGRTALEIAASANNTELWWLLAENGAGQEKQITASSARA